MELSQIPKISKIWSWSSGHTPGSNNGAKTNPRSPVYCRATVVIYGPNINVINWSKKVKRKERLNSTDS